MFFSHQALRQRLYLVPSSQIKQWGNTTGKIWQWACSASLLPLFFPLGRKLLWRFKCIYCNIGRGSCGAVPPPLVAAPAGALGTWPWGHIGALPPTALAVWGFCLPACSGASLVCCGVLSTEPGVQLCHRESYRASVRNSLVPGMVGGRPPLTACLK